MDLRISGSLLLKNPSCFCCSWKEAVGSAKMVVPIYQSTQSHMQNALTYLLLWEPQLSWT